MIEGNTGLNDHGRWRQHDWGGLRHYEPGIGGCGLVVSIGISESRVEFGNGVAEELSAYPVFLSG